MKLDRKILAIGGILITVSALVAGGSVAQAVSGMVDMSAHRMSQDELDEIAAKIAKVRQRRKSKSTKGRKIK